MLRIPSFAALVLFASAGACSSAKDPAGAPPAPSGGSAGSSQAGSSAFAGDGNGQSGGGTSGSGLAGSAGSTAGGMTSGGASVSGTSSAGNGGNVPGSAPDFGPNVLIFEATTPMATIQAQITAISGTMATRASQFSTSRYAYLFKPGQYQLDVKLGFYMQVLGLGTTPDAVQITGGVRSRADWNSNNATLNFWRSAENFSVVPTVDNNMNIWAVSQGTALRRAHLKGPLGLSDGGFASGGFIADVQVDGAVASGSQQQFFSRNSAWTSWSGGVWNMVFAGIEKAPTGAGPLRRTRSSPRRRSYARSPT